MKFLSRLILFLGILVFVLFLAVAGAVWWLNQYIQGPEFAAQIKAEATRITGVPVQFKSVQWDIGHSFNLKSWQMENVSSDGKKASFTADEIRLDYNWRSFWNRSFDITDFEIINPSILIAQQSNGEFLLPFILPKAAGSAPDSTPALAPNNSSLQVVLREFKLERGKLEIKNADGSSRLLCNGITVSGDSSATDATSFQGQFNMVDTTINNKIKVNAFHTPYTYHSGALSLTALEAGAYGGKMTGSAEINLLDPQMPYNLKCDLQDFDMNQLLAAVAGQSNLMSGRMEGKTSWIGSAIDPLTASGQGTISVHNGQMINLSFFKTLSQVLGGVSGLAQPDFSECDVNYTMAERVVNVQSSDLKSALFELTGDGKIHFDSTLQMSMNLALNPEITRQIPTTITDFLGQRPDGYKLVPFNVTGTFNQPKMELNLNKQQILNQAVQTLQNMFGQKKGNGTTPSEIPAGLQNLFNRSKPAAAPAPTPVPVVTPEPAPATSAPSDAAPQPRPPSATIIPLNNESSSSDSSDTGTTPATDSAPPAPANSNSNNP